VATANDREGNVLNPPGTTQQAEIKPEEIVASYHSLTQKGVTLASGIGVVPAGSVLYRVSGQKKYTNVASGNGVVRGFLRDAVDATSKDKLGNIVLSGVLKFSKLKSENGTAPLAGGTTPTITTTLSDLNARYDAERDVFIF
jgi:hypothetical protein